MNMKDDYLLEAIGQLHFASHQEIGLAREEAKRSPEKSAIDVLLERRVLTPALVAQAKAAHFGVQAVELRSQSIHPSIIELVPARIAHWYGIIPIGICGPVLTVALADPSDLNTIDSLGYLIKHDVCHCVAAEDDIAAALRKYYPLSEDQLAEIEREKADLASC